MTNDPFALDAAGIAALLDPGAPAIPELEAARANPAPLRDAPQTSAALGDLEALIGGDGQIPVTPYTAYRRFRNDGDRKEYERPYFLKRRLLAASALRLFTGDETQRDAVHDYLWAICEESNWVLPAHERCRIDLFAAETGFVLADALNLLGDAIDPEVRARVRDEVEHRIFEPYLRFHELEWWYKGENNWNGVCNSSVAATFLLLDPEPRRAARAVAIALEGLRHFLSVAFEADGGSNEGVAYWHYGLFNLVALSELLRARTRGRVDLLDSPRMRDIAAYPARVQLSGSHFASFSDCDETVVFHPGFLARLAERTGERSVLNLLDASERHREHWRLTMLLRDALWWDGARPAAEPPEDALLEACGVARLAGRAPDGAPIALAVKAGHNAENHNQNDVGSFIVHVDGENLLTDPGRGLYSRSYFSAQRYENIFANSYGHSVPRVGGLLQAPGAERRGELLGVERRERGRTATLELAAAYAAPTLRSLRRNLTLAADGTITLDDHATYEGEPLALEEALITWLPVEAAGNTALVRGARHTLRLTVEEPAGASFALERLEEQCRANAKEGVLTRISLALPPAAEQRARIRMDIS